VWQGGGRCVVGRQKEEGGEAGQEAVGHRVAGRICVARSAIPVEAPHARVRVRAPCRHAKYMFKEGVGSKRD